MKAKLDPQQSESILEGSLSLRVTVFWIVSCSFILFVFFTSTTTELLALLGAALIIFAALLPVYLWSSSENLGLPILPIAALTFVPTHAFPLLYEHRQIRDFPVFNQFIAACTVTGFLAIATASWYLIVSRFQVRSTPFMALADNPQSYSALWIALLLFSAFSLTNRAGWINWDVGVYSLVRALIGSTGILSIFAFCYRWGLGKLNAQEKTVITVLIGCAIAADAASLLLYQVIAYFLIANIGYFLGSRNFPVIPLVIGLALFSFLQLGKAGMREAHNVRLVEPWDYPAWFAEWSDFSIQSLLSPKSEENKQAESATINDRAGLIHLLLLTQDQTPEKRPYMLGITYLPIPELLIPRILSSEKIWANEGTFLLNIYYGKQTRQSVYKTTIGWGLLAEAYANFGFVGCGLLGVLVGGFHGWSASWARNMPLLSARTLFSVLVLLSTLSTEYCATSYVSTLFQSSASLWLFSILLMEKVQPDRKQVLSQSSIKVAR